jgi:MEDS: MEthanogen/methylotroph, DcmR Sensory domain
MNFNASRAPLRVSENEVFWAEIAPTEHIVHLYANDAGFFDMLEGFAVMGLIADESVIVIATDAHIAHLNRRLAARGIDLNEARRDGRYLPFDAEAFLGRFMKEDGWPDEARFNEAVTELIERAGRNGRRVRAFGEMVALLWNKGLNGATVRLEHLWNDLRRRSPFPLFCSYPKSGFTQETQASLDEICAAHTKVISNRA